MAVIDRNDPEAVLIRRQELAARPRTPPPQRAWPTSGEFVASPRPRAPLPPVRPASPWPAPVLRFITRKAAEAAHSTASGSAGPAATPTPPSPPKPPSMPPHGRSGHVVHGRAIKVTVVLEPAEILAVPTLDGVSRVQLRVEAAGRALLADLSAKSVRKSKAAIAEHGPDGVACILQGRLEGAAILEAGLSAQPKTPKPAEPAA